MNGIPLRVWFFKSVRTTCSTLLLTSVIYIIVNNFLLSIVSSLSLAWQVPLQSFFASMTIISLFFFMSRILAHKTRTQTWGINSAFSLTLFSQVLCLLQRPAFPPVTKTGSLSLIACRFLLKVILQCLYIYIYTLYSLKSWCHADLRLFGFWSKYLCIRFMYWLRWNIRCLLLKGITSFRRHLDLFNWWWCVKFLLYCNIFTCT